MLLCDIKLISVCLIIMNFQAVKRARLVASSDDENDNDEGKDNQGSNTNTKQENGRSKASSKAGMPDGETIDKYLEMWGVVYTFVTKVVRLLAYSTVLYARELIAHSMPYMGLLLYDAIHYIFNYSIRWMLVILTF